MLTDRCWGLKERVSIHFIEVRGSPSVDGTSKSKIDCLPYFLDFTLVGDTLESSHFPSLAAERREKVADKINSNSCTSIHTMSSMTPALHTQWKDTNKHFLH